MNVAPLLFLYICRTFLFPEGKIFQSTEGLHPTKHIRFLVLKKWEGKWIRRDHLLPINFAYMWGWSHSFHKMSFPLLSTRLYYCRTSCHYLVYIQTSKETKVKWNFAVVEKFESFLEQIYWVGFLFRSGSNPRKLGLFDLVSVYALWSTLSVLSPSILSQGSLEHVSLWNNQIWGFWALIKHSCGHCMA